MKGVDRDLTLPSSSPCSPIRTLTAVLCDAFHRLHGLDRAQTLYANATVALNTLLARLQTEGERRAGAHEVWRQGQSEAAAAMQQVHLDFEDSIQVPGAQAETCESLQRC